VIETELSAQIFKDSDGEARTCTVIRDVTERVRMERELTAATERLRELALTDELTGLRNRRGFITAATQLLELADRQLTTLSVLFVDLDELKELNDGHGHPAGDAALRAVARAVTDALRRTDVVARIGGDEFAALALSMDESSRATIERRIRSFLRAPETVLTVGQRITVSIGWAERAPLGAQSVEDLIVEADQAMYRKKATNRD
jgi:diguanylate cyclase (GGDEF)-like protein